MAQHFVLFGGLDAAGARGLWVTNGTAAGTHELTGISGAYAGFGGLSPEDLTVFDGEVLFRGIDTAYQSGLWVTNGTATGAHELTGISGASAGGIFFNVGSPDFTVFNGQVLFAGNPGSGDALGAAYDSLWVTNGAAAGTRELTGITGANATGLFSGDIYPDFTIFKGAVLFDGSDAVGNDGLWVTNGTAAGTHELTGISGAFTGGGGLFHNGSPDFTVFNGAVLFEGTNAAELPGLWVTNGTAAGTHELTGISGAFSGGLFGGPPTTHVAAAPDLTVFNNEVLFNGLDTAGNNGLWVTDGTAAGTYELIGMSGAYAGGLDPVALTPFKDEVLFAGTDATGSRGLWVTDGTVAGTHEVTGISGAYSGGLTPGGFTVFHGKVVFNGLDTAANSGVGDGRHGGRHP